MKKVSVLFFLSVLVWAVPSCGLTRQEKDVLVNDELAYLGGRARVHELTKAFNMDELVILLAGDAFVARVVDQGPKKNDLIDKYVSSCDSALLRRIAVMEAHPEILEHFWRDCWNNASPELRADLLKDANAYLQAANCIRSLLEDGEDVVRLAAQWVQAGSTVQSLASDPAFAALARIDESFGLLEGLLSITNDGLFRNYFGVQLQGYDALKKGSLAEADTITSLATVFYLFGRTSMQGIERLFQEVRALPMSAESGASCIVTHTQIVIDQVLVEFKKKRM